MRLRAKQMKDGDDVVGLDVDPDETYNADEEGIMNKKHLWWLRILTGSPHS